MYRFLLGKLVHSRRAISSILYGNVHGSRHWESSRIPTEDGDVNMWNPPYFNFMFSAGSWKALIIPFFH
ncbi:hypothetical protein Y032_0061g3200 [Ancylostoma ceylanicum]|uniref:Uncharacterized protein n=1 Tax=Ancylostoma ceylanicum TaxID=53326 RepID=A0A016U2I7_9BILA|nr:hypothetical protein Y032_0061g3200 [Ancylostoma ceylanicum]